MKIEKLLTNEEKGLFVALVTNDRGKETLVVNNAKLFKEAIKADLNSSCLEDKINAIAFISAFGELPVMEFPMIKEAYKACK